MAENSKIEWTTHTFNPWRGCTKVSPGCANCYAETLSGRNPKTLGMWGPKGTRVVAAEAQWRLPLRWDREAKAAGERHRVFCASLADVFEDWQGPIADSRELLGHVFYSNGEWGFGPDTTGSGYSSKASNTRMLTMQDVRARLFKLIDATPNLDWLLLTKRPENIAKMMPVQDEPANAVRRNVWLGVSVENQAAADARIPHLLRTPAAVRFLSVEPLLGPIEFSNASRRADWAEQLGKKALSGIDWVIVGGESGPGARPCRVEWIRSIVEQCKAAGASCFVKQFGGNVLASNPCDPIDQFPNDAVPRFSQGPDEFTARIHLRDKKGGNPAEWPEDLRVRQFPEARSCRAELE